MPVVPSGTSQEVLAIRSTWLMAASSQCFGMTRRLPSGDSSATVSPKISRTAILTLTPGELLSLSGPTTRAISPVPSKTSAVRRSNSAFSKLD